MAHARSVAAVCLVVALALPALAAPEGSPDAVLQKKGLTKTGLLYITDADGQVVAAARALRVAKRKVDEDTQARRAVDEKISRVKSMIANGEFELKDVEAKITAAGKENAPPRLLARRDQLSSQLSEAKSFKAEQEALVKVLSEQARTAYTNLVVESAQKADAASKGYEALGADADVKAALDQLNAAARLKCKLGPTAEFTAAVVEIRKARSDITSAIVPFRTEGRIHIIDVTLNGKITRQMILDSGSSNMILPADMAEDIDLVPTDKDPTVRMQQADGKIIEGKQMVIKSVRVGAFSVENVECVVMPKTAVNVNALLGGSYLNSFVYRIDPAAGELHLAQLPGGDKRITTALNDPPAATKPAANTTDPLPPQRDPLPRDPAARDPLPRDPLPPARDPAVDPPPARSTRSNDPLWGDSPGPVGTDPVKGPATEPAAPTSRPGMTDAQVRQMLDYLEKEYKQKLQSPDWRQRALAVISLARLPQEEVTGKLLVVINNDKHDVVRLLAWQAVLARMSDLNQSSHRRWMESTLGLAEKGAFRGSMRLPLLAALSTMPMTDRSKRIFEQVFNETNAWESQDVPILKALGRCLGEWKSAVLARELIGAMRQENTAYRAEYVLQHAGCPVSPAKTLLPKSVFDPEAKKRDHMDSSAMWRMASNDYAKWVQTDKEWNDRPQLPAEIWRTLKPMYVPPPVSREELAANPKLWKADLELGSANVKSFEVVFLVDATGSMGDVLTWLTRDVAKMANALSALSMEPRLGLTFYRGAPGDEFVTRNGPLTSRVDQVVAALRDMTAEGGNQDTPDEDVLDGVRDALRKHPWSKKNDGSKVIVLIGDAPPHPQDVKEVKTLVGDAAKNGFRFYPVKVTTSFGANDLSVFDELAKISGTVAIDAVFPRLSYTRFINPTTKKEIPLQTIERPEAQTIIAPPPVADHPGEKILATILSDAINPQYRDRLHPLTKTLLAYCEPNSPDEKRRGFPANTPVLETTTFDPQK